MLTYIALGYGKGKNSCGTVVSFELDEGAELVNFRRELEGRKVVILYDGKDEGLARRAVRGLNGVRECAERLPDDGLAFVIGSSFFDALLASSPA